MHSIYAGITGSWRPTQTAEYILPEALDLCNLPSRYRVIAFKSVTAKQSNCILHLEIFGSFRLDALAALGLVAI
jgi:hypothetical protein